MLNLWNDSESRKVFFLIPEKTGAAASYSQPVNLSVVRSDLWEEAFRCCVTVSLLMPTLGVSKSEMFQFEGKCCLSCFFFYFVLWAIATTTPTAEIRGRGDIVTTKSRQAKKHNQMTNHLFYSGERNEKIRGNVRNITQAVRRVLQSKRTDLFYENFFLIQQPPRIFRMTSFVSAFQKPFTQLGDCFVICRCWRLSSLDNATQEKLFLSDWGQQSSPSTQRMC